MLKRSLLCLTLFTFSGCDAPAVAETVPATDPLTIRLEGVRGQQGKIFLTLKNSPASFNNYDSTDAVAWLAVPPGTKVITIDNIPPGTYAISAFHDENGNGEYDMVEDVPEEGWGNSGNVGQWETPSFGAAAFSTRTATVQMHYLD